ncbi:MAG TPA: class I SAM-dependent methyltransferase [Candidatus Dormibacteraeota bacterium]|nr:class I SAM-dependent methyltransferase [Candidatus Dormibacteraeota bacterium]
MYYLDFLGRVHEVLEPPTYLEIGVRHGDSLALTRTVSVGIDPEFNLRVELPDGVSLFEEPSDDYFARADPLAPFGGTPIGLSFIDGLHWSEFALRDFVNVEQHSRWTTAVVFDDIFPGDVRMAGRNRRTRKWTGDVFKILGFLEKHRPDLVCLRIDTQPTGLLLVLGLDPHSDALNRHYDEMLGEALSEDPQEVPPAVLERREALDPETVLRGSFWKVLRDAREHDTPRAEGLPKLRAALERDGLVSAEPPPKRSWRERLPLPV